MNSKHFFRSSPLQQQPRRPVNPQQQQSSGSGEFQPRPSRLSVEATHARKRAGDIGQIQQM